MIRNAALVLGLVLQVGRGAVAAAPPAPAPAPALPRPVDATPLRVAPPAPGQRDIPLNQVDPKTLALVRSYTQRFYDGEVAYLFGRLSPEMRRQLTIAQLTQMREHVLANYGTEQRLIAERAAVNDTYRGFVRWAQFDKVKDVIEIIWYLKPDDSIGGFFIRPVTRSEPGPAQEVGGSVGGSG